MVERRVQVRHADAVHALVERHAERRALPHQILRCGGGLARGKLFQKALALVAAARVRLLLQLAQVFRQRLARFNLLAHFVQHIPQFVRQERLQQVIVHAQRHGRFCVGKFAVAADDERFDLAVCLLHTAQQVQPAQLRHIDIGDEDIRAQLRCQLGGAPAVVRLAHHAVAVHLIHGFFQKIAEALFVVRDQHTILRHSSSSSSTICAGKTSVARVHSFCALSNISPYSMP